MDQEVGEDAVTAASRFEVTPPLKPKLLGETLSLTGGPGGGDWKWTANQLQIGATILGGCTSSAPAMLRSLPTVMSKD